MYNLLNFCTFLNRIRKTVRYFLLMELSNGQVAMMAKAVKALG